MVLLAAKEAVGIYPQETASKFVEKVLVRGSRSGRSFEPHANAISTIRQRQNGTANGS